MSPDPAYFAGTSVRASSLGLRHWIAVRSAGAVSTIATITVARICAAQPVCTLMQTLMQTLIQTLMQASMQTLLQMLMLMQMLMQTLMQAANVFI